MTMMLDKTKRIPLYMQCEDYILTAIENGKYAAGEFLPPERDLSSRLNVNRLTLRKALATLIQKGFIENIPGSGNRVLMHASEGERTKVISCLMLRTKGAPALSPYFAEVFEGLHREVERRGYDLAFMPVSGDALWKEDGSEREVANLVRSDMSGVVVLGGVTRTLVEAYERAGVPVVLLDKPSDDPSTPSIMPDNVCAAQMACRHLLELGHQQIGYIAGGYDPVSEARQAGLTSILRKAGLKLDERWIIRGDYGVFSAQRAVNAFIEQHGVTSLPTAFIAVNDESAFGAMKAFSQHGVVVPDDVSLVGFDDIPWAVHLEPPLTTVRIPRIEMGEWAMRLLMDRIERISLPAADVQLQSKLIIRESTCPPRK